MLFPHVPMNLTNDLTGGLQLESRPNDRRGEGGQRRASFPVPFVLDLSGHDFLFDVVHVHTNLMATIPQQNEVVYSGSYQWVVRDYSNISPFPWCDMVLAAWHYP